MSQIDRRKHLPHQEEPIAAPGDVAAHSAKALDFDGDILSMPIARDVFQCHRVRTVVLDRNPADGRVEDVFAIPDAAQMTECHRDADCPVAAHAQEPDVIEKDHTGRAFRLRRCREQVADDKVRATRFTDHRPAKRVAMSANRSRC